MKRLLTIATALMFSTSAFAWYATVQGPDVFGETTVIAGEEGTQTSLIVQCTSDGELYLAMISPKKEFEDVPTVPATMYFATGSNTPVKIEATVREWNDKYLGIVSNVEKSELMPLITGIRDAKGPIKVGAEIRGNRMSDSYPSRGSTAAISKVIAGCKLN